MPVRDPVRWYPQPFVARTLVDVLVDPHGTIVVFSNHFQKYFHRFLRFNEIKYLILRNISGYVYQDPWTPSSINTRLNSTTFYRIIDQFQGGKKKIFFSVFERYT